MCFGWEKYGAQHIQCRSPKMTLSFFFFKLHWKILCCIKTLSITKKKMWACSITVPNVLSFLDLLWGYWQLAKQHNDALYIMISLMFMMFFCELMMAGCCGVDVYRLVVGVWMMSLMNHFVFALITLESTSTKKKVLGRSTPSLDGLKPVCSITDSDDQNTSWTWLHGFLFVFLSVACSCELAWALHSFVFVCISY